MALPLFQFSDVSSALIIDASGNPVIAFNYDCINQSIQSILSTTPGERIMMPTFGSNIPFYLFEPITPISVKMLQKDIQTALATWENRVTVTQVSVLPNYDQKSYAISIYYAYSGATAPGIFTANLRVQ